MSCNTFNFTVGNCCPVEIGKNFRIKFNMSDGDTGNPVDLTGRDLTLTIKDPSDTNFTPITLSEVSDALTSGLYYIDVANGNIIIQILDDISTTLQEKTYVYEMSDNTEKTTLMMGGIQVIKGQY